MRTGNPTLTDSTFSNVRSYDSSDTMTIQGTTTKTMILLFLVLVGASWAWSNLAAATTLLLPAMIIGFIVAMVTVFKKEWAAFTSPVYALVEGVILGGISSFFEKAYPGIVMQAVGLTCGTLFSLLLAYKSGMIKVTDNFQLGIFAATGGIALFYLASFILSFFHIPMPLIYSSSPFGIAFSIIVVIVAALNLVLDFDFIEQGARMNVPKYMEWYGAFGLIVTLIWLYLEILRLLAKLKQR